jgi:hypothetical protein
MKGRILYRMIGIILLFGLILPMWGQSDTVFGPRQYTRGTGKPVVHQDTFSSAPGEGLLLRVRNGDADKATQVSSTTIVLNGVQVVGPADFNKGVVWIEKQVNLLSQNAIAVTLDSKPGSFITVTIIGGTAGPSVSMNASPPSIELGQSSTLTWTSANADSAVIDNGIGAVPLNGSMVVSPTETTTYTITVTGPGGTATAGATVTVTIPKPAATLTATPAAITLGESATLAWTSANADSAVIDNGIGVVSLNGSMVVSPTETTTYTMTVTGPGGTATANATVTVTIPEPTVGITATPAAITLGESTTLAWTSTYADSAVIDNGVGAVPVNGSMVVSPVEDTVYTITVTGPGGTASASVAVTVENPYPKPTVTLAAAPATINPGEASTLTWTSADAETVSISPDIGTVGLNGSTSVSPTTTTTYTITATGLGGTSTATATVTVYYPPPTVTISAYPTSIQVGQTATLTWSSTEGDSAAIDQGIGSVPLEGTLTVTPSQDTLYTITVTGPGGSVSESVWVTITPLTFAITYPADGATITSPSVNVQGTIVNPSGNETGVVVNGVIAVINGNQFTAYHVPVLEGSNTIEAQAKDKDGFSSVASIQVTGQPGGHYVTFKAEPPSGISPLELDLKINASFDIPGAQLSYMAAGQVEFLTPTEPDSFKVRLTGGGVYTFTVYVTYDGQTYSDTVGVKVWNQTDLDALLRDHWNGMKVALAQGDATAASNYFTGETQEKYFTMFDALSDSLPTIAQGMGEIQPVNYASNQAKYRIYREQIIQGTPQNITYYIYFIVDIDGLWKVFRF